MQSFWLNITGWLVVCSLLLYIGLCEFFGALAQNIKICLIQLNNSITSERQNYATLKCIEHKQKLCEIIRFHSVAKELSPDSEFVKNYDFIFVQIIATLMNRLLILNNRFPGRFSNEYSFLLTALFVLSTTLLCCTILSLDAVSFFSFESLISTLLFIKQKMKSILELKFIKNSHTFLLWQALEINNTINSLRLFFCLSMVIIYMLVLCLFGFEVTIKFEGIHESLHMCSWNEFPFEIQKLLPTMLIISRNPEYIQGYFNTKCTREFLNKVLN